MVALVVAAHPDDEVLGAGGTMARLTTEGHTVITLILARGLEARLASGETADQSAMDQHRGNSERANRVLGVENVIFTDFPDNRMDSVDLLDVTKEIEKVINEFGPEIVFTQHGGDLNIDHVVTYRATLTATRPMKGTPVKRLYSYEVMSSTEWAFQKFQPHFHPDTFFDIEPFLEKKVEAMQCYEFESRPFPHPRAPESLKAAALRWGSTCGLGAAEAFQTVRAIY